MSHEIIPNIERKSIRNSIKNGIRADGRDFLEYRKIEVSIGEYKSAEGSAKVKIGDTFVATGVKVGKGVPYPDTPESGVLSSNAELVPTASEQFQPGPPSEDDIELARVVDRGIRESKCIDFEKLCITPEEEVYMVYIDSYVLDYDGNHIDAAALASIAALHNAEVPEFGKLPISKKPVANTFIKVDGNILLDPSHDEEKVMDARLTITMDEFDNVCAMQMAGPGYFTKEEIHKCFDVAKEKTKELRKLIEQ